MRAGEIRKRPVVTYDGEDVAQVKDLVYAPDRGSVLGFTLNGRGLFAGPLKTALPWGCVAALGRDAVMVEDEDALRPRDDLLRAAADEAAGDVLGSTVLTDDGTELGTVVDVVVEVADDRTTHADVVGYQIEPSAALGRGHKRLLVPLPDTLAASAQHLIVPAAAKEFVEEDLAGFGAAVDAFRARLREGA